MRDVKEVIQEKKNIKLKIDLVMSELNIIRGELSKFDLKEYSLEKSRLLTRQMYLCNLKYQYQAIIQGFNYVLNDEYEIKVGAYEDGRGHNLSEFTYGLGGNIK